MSDKINLRELERRAYLSYHEDGILDVIIGFGLITAALWVLADMPWLIGSWIPIMTPMYIQIKKKVTVPRLGQVEFSQQRKGKTRKTVFALVAFNIIMLAAGFYVWWAWDIGGKPQWLLDLLSNYMVITGALGAIISWVVAYITDLRRFYGYGLMNLIIFTLVGNMGVHISVSLVAVGVGVTLYGLYLFSNFRKKYTVLEE